MTAVVSASPLAGTCLHCGQSAAGDDPRFCCLGCASVYALLHDEGLERYYELGSGVPLAGLAPRADHKWIETVDRGAGWIVLDVQGLHCAACVWLFDRVFAKRPGAIAIQVNPALGTLRLGVGEDFDLLGFVVDIERFGYRLGLPNKLREGSHDPIVLRMGICIALAMNAMLFALAFYAGLDAGPVFRLFHGVELALGVLSVLIGGSYFVRTAVLGLRQGVVHLDVPIALGIVLAFVSSVLAYLTHRSTTYFDTLTVFIALMLVGRFLQERVLRRNRRELLAHDGVEGLLTRRIEGEKVVLTPCVRIETGDVLLVAPGDLVPVDAVLRDERGSCSLDWINGESTPRDLRRGDRLVAGAFNAGDRAFTCLAAQAFAESAVVELVKSGGFARRPVHRWERFARVYVVAVLGVAGLGFFGWWLLAGDLLRALEVTAGTLIITCPCAFGIATPLGYELVQARLRRLGLFVQTGDFLDRARDVRQIVFDKTGTLTTGLLDVADPEALRALPTRDLLYNLTCRSAHPKSAAIARVLADVATFDPALVVTERAGHGLALGALRLERDGEALGFFDGATTLARIEFREHLRDDAKREVRRLREAGYDVWIASGDTTERVQRIADEVGIEQWHGGFSPNDKASLVERLGKALMIGDGINDALAAERAYCSGTPAIDRPFLPARTDFYFTTPGLGPVTQALAASRVLAGVQRRNLRIAVAYNTLGVTLAWAGLLSPLACAVLMPVSSLSVVLATVFSLSRSTSWKS